MLGLAASASFAGTTGTIYDASGFEPPAFTAGPLAGQDGGAWVESGSGATALVQSGVVASGSQAVLVTRSSGDDRFFPVLNSNPALKQVLLVDWDMNVSSGTNGQAPFGPFFGIEAYTPQTQILGAAGVDATTGDVLYEAPRTGILTPTGQKIAFGTFNHFQLAVDYKSRNFSVFLNGKLIQKTNGFVDTGATGFSDADISALAAADEPPVQTGSAVFDNYTVRTADANGGGQSVPLPAALWPSLFVLMVVGFGSRRWRRICRA